LTEDEKQAILTLLKGAGGAMVEDNLDDDDTKMTVIQKICAQKCKQREEVTMGEYMNTGFILGSAAEVEHIWSHAGNLLTKGHHAMMLMLLEAILFLKMNMCFWDQGLVLEAYVMQHTSCSAKCIQADEEQLEGKSG
jgi:hypothetical protein